jgi:hypothetical protein
MNAGQHLESLGIALNSSRSANLTDGTNDSGAVFACFLGAGPAGESS